MRVQITVPGEPKGKERPRYSGKSGTIYTPNATLQYEKMVATAFKAECHGFKFPEGEPLDMRILAYLPVPQSDDAATRLKKLSGEIRPTKKPDWDNIGKIIADALNGVAYHDDAQVVDAQTRKFYSDNPRVEIIIQNIQKGQTK